MVEFCQEEVEELLTFIQVSKSGIGLHLVRKVSGHPLSGRDLNLILVQGESTLRTPVTTATLSQSLNPRTQYKPLSADRHYIVEKVEAHPEDDVQPT